MTADHTSGYLYARIRAGHADWEHAAVLAWIGGTLRVVDIPPRRLTARQHAVLAFIRGYTGRHGYAPTLREIAAGVGFASPSAAAYQVGQLRRLGYLTHPHKDDIARSAGLTAGGAA